MCMDGVGHLLMEDEGFQRMLAHPDLDFVHRQVVMTLYSLQMNNRLHEWRETLPIYLSQTQEQCEEIVAVLARAGLVNVNGAEISLPYEFEVPESDHSCACHTC